MWKKKTDPVLHIDVSVTKQQYIYDDAMSTKTSVGEIIVT